MSYYNHPERLDPIIRGGDGGIALAASWFENIVKRIEHIKPVAVGQSNGIQTGNDAPVIEVVDREGGDGREIRLNVTKVTLNVCSNGVPATINVLVAP
jgi:hypothetical protein